MKLYFLVAIVWLGVFQPVYAQNKIDPYFNVADESNVSLAKSVVSDQVLVSVIIKTSDPEATRSFILTNGGEFHTVVGGIVTADVPMGSIQELSELPDTLYVEAPKALALNLDESSDLIGAWFVHSGKVNNISYTGKGVIVGVIDSGIDWSHSVFNDATGESRIVAIWDQTIKDADGFSSPSEIGDPYGIECLNTHIKNGNCPSYDFVGHGTHVAGIAAGRDDLYNGIAPEAELIIVKTADISNNKDYTPSIPSFGMFSNRVIDAANYIFTKANALGKPAVINISLGSNFGAHDGSSLFEQALDGFLTDAIGRSIAVSAGNNNHQSDGYFSSIHAGTSLSGETKAVEFHGLAPYVHGLILDIWQAEDSELLFGIGISNYDSYETIDPVLSGNIIETTSADGKLKITIDSSEVSNPLNGKKHTIVNISAVDGNSGAEISSDNYAFDLIVSGKGKFDSWIADGGGVFAKRSGSYQPTGYDYIAGDSKFTVGIPSTAKNVISVASFSSRSSLWLGSSTWNGLEFTEVGAISSFSSFGPTVDPEQTGQKPEITAPGEWIVSALSEQAVNNVIKARLPRDIDGVKFVAMRGTSMASPHVAGAIALLFERDPNLSADNIKKLLARNADTNGIVAPDNRWGYGRLDILNTMINFETTDLETPLTLSKSEVEEIPFKPSSDANIVQNEVTTGSGGCSLIEEKGKNTSDLPYMVFITLIIVGFVRGKRSISLLICIVFFVSCGGSGGGSNDPLDLSASIASGTLNFGTQYVTVDVGQQTVVYYSVDSGNLKSSALGISFKHFYPDETIEVGADNLFSGNLDQAMLMINEYVNKGVISDGNDDLELKSSWISVSGTLQLKETSIKDKGHFLGELKDIKLREVDLATGTFKRDGTDIIILSASVDANVTNGGTSNPVITNVSPLTGELGTEVTMKGFNLEGNKIKVNFNNCNGDFSNKLISAYELAVNVAGFCSDTRFKVTVGSNSYTTSETFEIAEPEIYKVAYPETSAKIEKAVLDSNNNILYVLFESSDELHIYSLAEKKFIETISLPGVTKAFDVSKDGKYILTGSGLNINLLDVEQNYAVSKSYVVDKKGSINDVFFGPSSTALALVSPSDWWASSYVGFLDTQKDTLTYPKELELTGFFTDEMKFSHSRNRDAIIARGYGGGCPYDVEVYRIAGDGGSFVKRGVDLISCSPLQIHPVVEELWAGYNIYDFELNKKGYFSSTLNFGRVIFSEDGHLITTVESPSGFVNIYDYVTSKLLVSSLRLSSEKVDLKLLEPAFISDGDKDLIVLTSDHLYQVDFQLLVGWLKEE